MHGHRPAALSLALGVLAAGAAAAERAASFSTGQAADLLLSGYGFNRTGGPLRFNHPGGVAVVSGRLVLADRNNNRVLVWAGVPRSGTEAPALVLGQDSFDTNAPGSGLDGLNWPTAVATDGTRLYVADAYNDRVLVWRTLPTRNRQPADFALTAGVSWPWGLWTDGRRLAVSATFASRVLVWNGVPEADRAADAEIRIAEFGTPRAVASDGVRLLVSDHNARVSGTNAPGTFFWNAFPTGPQAADTFVRSPGGGSQGEHAHDATFLSDGRLLALFNRSLCVWSSFPRSASEPCALTLGGGSSSVLDAGDNSGLAVHEGRLLVSLNNGNRVVVYDSLPAASGQLPDFALGSPDVLTNTLVTDHIVTNPVPLTDGQRLYVSSDYDRKLHVWRSLPTRDGQPPDHTYALDFAPWANARVGEGVALAGQGVVALWSRAPEGQAADTVFRGTIGSTSLGDLRGVAWDGTYFYLASYDRNRVWAWRGVPGPSSAPVAEITLEQPGRLSSDGRTLAVSHGGPASGVKLYDVGRLSSGGAPATVGATLRINLPQGVLLAEGALFVPDTNGNRVLVWRDAADAAAGLTPDAVLGARDLEPKKPAIGVDTLFWPGAVAFDGRFLWVGEFKFSNRILRFTAR